MYTLSNKHIYTKINASKEVNLPHFIYLSVFLIYIINQMFYKTMFNVYMKGEITTLINFFMLFMILFKIIMFDKYSLKKLILVIILSVLSFIAYFKSGYNNLFYSPILIIGAKNIDFNKICKIYLFSGILVLFISIIGIQLDIIEHIVHFRNGKYRYSFGSIYPTDFAARIFFLCTAYAYLKNKKFNIIDGIIFIMIGCFTFYFCDARLDSISIFILSILLIVSLKVYNYKNKHIGNFSKFILVWSIPIFAIASIVITNLYTPDSNIAVWLNHIFSDRLVLGKIGIMEYGFSLFGQTIEMVGNGGLNGSVSNYFFIDSSYLYIGLRYGIIVLLIVCLSYALFIQKCIKNIEILLPIIIIVIGINSIVAHHFIDVAYNPFILVFLSNVDYNKKINYEDKIPKRI